MKALFFSPFANIWEHSFPEALVAESFGKHGIDVELVRCAGMLQVHCVAMSAVGVGPNASLRTRQQVCSACIKRRDLITSTMALSTLVMDSWVDDDDRATVDRLVGEITPDTWTELELDGVPLGRYAAYEMWIKNKLVDSHLSPELWVQYLGQFRNTVLTFLTAKRILADRKPDAVVVYNDHYSVNHAFTSAARLLGIASYTVHGGNHVTRRAETLSMFASDYTMEGVFQSKAYQSYRHNPIGQTEVDLVGGHFSGLLEASSAFAYSSKFEGTGSEEIRTKFGIAPGAPVLAATMSSEDELLAVRLIDAIPTTLNQKSLFTDQFEWVNYLFEYAQSHPELHLILRLHPRMFPNKREGVLSPVVSRIMALRDGAPANVSFNMPEDGIGLYDLMQVVDVLLNFRSTVGAELTAFGIPVVVPSNNDFFTYPSELNLTGHTKTEFRAQIEKALTDGWSIENTRRSFRWHAFFFSRVVVDFSDAVNSRPIAIRPKKPGLRLWLWKKFVYVVLQYGPLVRERLALRNRGLSKLSQDVLRDVLENHLNSASDSSVWPPLDSTAQAETEYLNAYLRDLSSTLWADIQAPDSLAGRVRSYLATV